MSPIESLRRFYSHDHAPAEAERLAQRAALAYAMAEADQAEAALFATADEVTDAARRLAAKLRAGEVGP